jgi:hypothetical protein
MIMKASVLCVNRLCTTIDMESVKLTTIYFQFTKKFSCLYHNNLKLLSKYISQPNQKCSSNLWLVTVYVNNLFVTSFLNQLCCIL